MKKGIKFCEETVLNLILFFKRLNVLKYRDKMKQEKCKLTLFYNRRHSQGMELTSLPANNLSVFVYIS